MYACFYFQRGKCRYSTGCKFLHERVCFRFQKDGYCTQQNCRDVHVKVHDTKDLKGENKGETKDPRETTRKRPRIPHGYYKQAPVDLQQYNTVSPKYHPVSPKYHPVSPKYHPVSPQYKPTDEYDPAESTLSVPVETDRIRLEFGCLKYTHVQQ